MARKSKTGGRGQGVKSNLPVLNMGKMGIPQSEDAKKTKGVNVIQGVIPLELKQIPPLMVTLMTTSRKNGSPNVVTGQNDEQSTGKTS